MLDNQIIREIRKAIQAGFMANGWLGGDSIGWGDAPEAWSAELGWDVRNSFGGATDPAWGDAGLSWGNNGSSNIAVKQAYQPTMQGANREPTLYLYKVSDRRHGSPFRRTVFVPEGSWEPSPVFDQAQVWSGNDGKAVKVEAQVYETTFQINALVKQDPSKLDGYTASDILNYCAAVLQSEETRTAFRAAGLDFLRISDVRNPYFLSDRGGFEASPSLDFVVIHNQVLSSSVPFAVKTGFVIERV